MVIKILILKEKIDFAFFKIIIYQNLLLFILVNKIKIQKYLVLKNKNKYKKRSVCIWVGAQQKWGVLRK